MATWQKPQKIFHMATWPCSSQCLRDVRIDRTSNHNDMLLNVNVSNTTERIPSCKETLPCQMTISNF